jgi:heptosyltransferase-3
MQINIDNIRSVLVLVPDKHMGDLILALPAISSLKKIYRDKEFHIAVDSEYREIIETMDGLGNILYYPRKLLREKPFFKRLSIMFDFIRHLRKISPDIAIDLHCGIASSTLTFLSGAPLRVGSATAKRAYLYNLKVNLTRNKHKLNSYSEIAAAAGVNNTSPIRLKAPENKRSSLSDILLKEMISPEKPIACLHPGAGVVYKQWTNKGFTEISDWLSLKGFQVIFIGGKPDSSNISHIMSRLQQRAYNFSEKLSLGELLALLQTSAIYIGNDSGPMHLADAAGIPVIALFGPAHKGRWGPVSEKSIVLRGDEPCETCKGKDCQYDFKCVRTIPVESVKGAVEKLLNNN